MTLYVVFFLAYIQTYVIMYDKSAGFTSWKVFYSAENVFKRCLNTDWGESKGTIIVVGLHTSVN